MATLTRQEISDRALEALGVKAAGVNAIAEDGNRSKEKVDAVYNRLRREGLAPFALATVPDWAQTQLINLVAVDLAPDFGVSGQRLQLLGINQEASRIELGRQVANMVPPIPVRSESF